MNKYTKEDLREAFRAGVSLGSHNSYFDTPLNEDEYIESLNPKEEEERIPITYGLIKATFGWSRFCDITNGNHYAIAEHGHPEDMEVYYITKSQAKELNIL